MMDLPQGADLAAHRLVPCGGLEELERSLLTLDVIAHAVDLGEAALPDHVQDLEAVLDDFADRVLRGLAPRRGSQLGRVGFGEGPAAPRGRRRAPRRIA